MVTSSCGCLSKLLMAKKRINEPIISSSNLVPLRGYCSRFRIVSKSVFHSVWSSVSSFLNLIPVIVYTSGPVPELNSSAISRKANTATLVQQGIGLFHPNHQVQQFLVVAVPCSGQKAFPPEDVGVVFECSRVDSLKCIFVARCSSEDTLQPSSWNSMSSDISVFTVFASTKFGGSSNTFTYWARVNWTRYSHKASAVWLSSARERFVAGNMIEIGKVRPLIPWEEKSLCSRVHTSILEGD